jgi:rRNA maturation endonuclease Nob1
MSETRKTKNTGAKTSGRVLLLDASAFIAGYEASDIDAEQYTVPSVREELNQESFPRIRFDNAVRNKRLKILNPNDEYVAEPRWTLCCFPLASS